MAAPGRAAAFVLQGFGFEAGMSPTTCLPVRLASRLSHQRQPSKAQGTNSMLPPETTSLPRAKAQKSLHRLGTWRGATSKGPLA